VSSSPEGPGSARRRSVLPNPPRRLRLVPLGPELLELVGWLAGLLGERLSVAAVVEPVVQGEAEWLTPERSQLFSGRIVDSLLEYYPPPEGREPVEWVLGLTAADLRAGGRDFVFGEATLGGGWAVVSVARLGAAGEPAFRERLAKEALHELGHLAGLRHCDRSGCLMQPAVDVSDVDAREAVLCDRCRRDGARVRS
jgi:archaemetzincin